MSVIMFPGTQEEPVISEGKIEQQKQKSSIQFIRDWKRRYNAWLKGEGKTIEEGRKLGESKTGIEQATRFVVGEEAGDTIKQITGSLSPENFLKQITRIAVILIVGSIGILALMQVMPVPSFRR